jgi:Tat protein secretion system quality control protein TatD with DNase activity
MNKKLINEAKRLQELAGINEVKIQPSGTGIIDFLKQNKQELLNQLAVKFNWDEDDMEYYSEQQIEMAADEDGDDDQEIAGLGEGGLDFSFNPKKVKDTYGDSTNFKLTIAGKPVYGISYNI